MSAYMLPFKVLDAQGKATDIFKASTNWDDVCNLYKFDRKLRLLIFDAIERIEIALRTQIIYQLSHKYGAHWQEDASLFKTRTAFLEVNVHIDKYLSHKKSRRTEFINHYLDVYDDPPTPPSWMSIELLYFSHLSKICENLKNRPDRTAIANAFGVPSDDIFCSWLHSISYVRNICAHHARLWNIKLAVQPEKFKYNKPDKIWLTDTEVDAVQSSKLYYVFCVVLFLLQTVNTNTKFKIHFFELLQKYPIVNAGAMGFPAGWENHPLWQTP